MKRLKNSFKYIVTLEFFLKEQSLNIEEFTASLDVPQRVEFRKTLKLLVAYNTKYKELSTEGHSSPYSQWIDSVFATNRFAALARPSHNAQTLSSTFLTSPLWVTLDRVLGRSVIQFLILEACLFSPQPNRLDCYIQLTGDPVPYERPLRSASTKWSSSNGVHLSKCHRLSAHERALVNQKQSEGPKSALLSQTQIPLDIITHIKFVIPLAFNHTFPPSKTKWMENYENPEHAQEYAEPILHDLCPNLMALDSMLAEISKKLGTGVLERKFRSIGTRKFDVVPKHMVSKFCCSSLRYLLPPETLGSRENWRLLETKIYQYIKLNGHSKFYIGRLMNGFKLTETWLGKSSSKQQAVLDQKFFMQFIYWVFTLLNEYLLRFFVIRQCGVGTGDIYLKVKGWRGARRRVQAEFTQALTRIERPLEWQKLIAANSHVVPKARPGAYRVLVNLNKFKAILGSANSVLKYHANSSLEIPNIKSVNEVFPYIHKFMEDHACDNFYAVRTDIQGCFDEANSAKVLELVKALVSPSTSQPLYVRRVIVPLFTAWDRTVSTVAKLGSVKRHQGRSFPESNLLSAIHSKDDLDGLYHEKPSCLANTLPENARNQVFVEKSHKSHLVPGDSVFNKVERILQNLIVQVDQEYYLMDQGIPQGSSISTSLCNLLCQEFIRTQLPRFWSSQDVLILRYVDDFLFITTNRLEAELFLKTITRTNGFPEFGISFSPAKTECNFGRASVNRTSFLGIPISWRGNKISILPSLGLESLSSAVKSSKKHSLMTCSPSMKVGREIRPVCVGRLPVDLASFIDTKQWAFGDSAWVDIEKIISLKTLKLAVVFRTFTKIRETPTTQYIQRVVRYSVRNICRLLLALELDLNVSRKIVYRFLKLLIRSSGIRTRGIIKYGMGVWLNFYKRLKNL